MLKLFSPSMSKQSQNPLLSDPSTSSILSDGQCSVLPIGRHCPLKNVSSGDSQKRSLEMHKILFAFGNLIRTIHIYVLGNKKYLSHVLPQFLHSVI
jgi:hypothetical protein